MSDIEALEKLAEAITTIDRLEKELTLHAELEAKGSRVRALVEQDGFRSTERVWEAIDNMLDTLRRIDAARKGDNAE